MKRILCYGDSNTYGCDSRQVPVSGCAGRFDEQTRWPCLLQEKLGPSWRVCEAGMNGRTTVFDDPIAGARNGLAALEVVFKSSDPLDVVIVMLGTNDLKDQFSASAQVIASGMERLLLRLRELIAQSLNPAAGILLVAPANVRRAADGRFYYDFSERSVEKGRALPGLYEALAKTCGCLFADANQWVETDLSDGVHLNQAGHKLFADKIAEMLLQSC